MRKPFRISRRSFLKVSGATGIILLTANMIKPATKLFQIPEKKLPEQTEGMISEKWVNSSCLNCPARCATRVRIVNGKAVRITGNPLSMVSEGEICPRGHIGLQVLYDEERITTPLKRTNKVKGSNADPGWVGITWDEALTEISTRLKANRENQGPERMVVFNGLNSRSNEDLIKRYATAYGTPNVISGDSLENEAVKVGRWLADGNYGHIAYDIGKANYVLSFGGSIVESERPLARNLRLWGKIRRERSTRAKVVVIDPRYSVTAAKADQWLAINPGTDAILALAIANVIIENKLYDKEFVEQHTTGFESLRVDASKYAPETAAEITGVPADRIRSIAREFAETRPAIAWVGRGVAGWPHGTMTSYTIFCLNALVGSIDIPGGIMYQNDPVYRELPKVVEDDIARSGLSKERIDRRKQVIRNQEISTNTAIENMLTDKPYPIQMAIGCNSNFNMTAPGAAKWEEALKRIPYYIHIGPFISEMALFADVVLPTTTFLEEWGYDHSPAGSGFAEVKIKQPVVGIKTDTRNIADIIFEITNRAGGTIAESFTGIGDNSEGFTKYRTGDLISWQEFSDNGVWVRPQYEYRKYHAIFNNNTKKFEFDSSFMVDSADPMNAGIQRKSRHEAPVFQGKESEFPLIMTTYQPVLTMENGSQNYPWAQEIFLAMHGVGWTSLAEINAETAHQLHVNDGDEVWVESQFGRLKMKARVTAWLHPKIVAIARGQGHFAPGKWQKGIGINPNAITGLSYDQLSGQSALYNTRVKVYRA